MLRQSKKCERGSAGQLRCLLLPLLVSSLFVCSIRPHFESGWNNVFKVFFVLDLTVLGSIFTFFYFKIKVYT